MIETRVLASSSAGNCYWVSDGTTPLLLEAGIRFEQIREGVGFKVTSLVGCLISHEHGDHARSVGDLLRAGVDVYASRGTIEALGLTHHRLQPVEALEPVTIGTWRVLPFEAVHDAAEPLGFLMASPAGKLLYLTDSAYCKYRFAGVTHLMIECNHSVEMLRRNVRAQRTTPEHRNRVLANHMALERLLDMLRANDWSQLQEIHLLHLSDENADEAQFKDAVQRVTGKPVYVANK